MGSVFEYSYNMKFPALIVLAAAVSAKDIRLQAPPTEIEYGFCEGSNEIASFDVITVEPFPIVIANGATVTIQIMITLKEEIPVGSQVHLDGKLEGLIPIPIPCLEIGGLHIGSCDYDVDELLTTVGDFLCPDYVPEGQACALPLSPGVYGGSEPLTVGPIEDIPDILLPFLKGTIAAEGKLTSASGMNLLVFGSELLWIIKLFFF